MLLGCSWDVPGLFPGCSWDVPGMFLGCSSDVPRMFLCWRSPTLDPSFVSLWFRDLFQIVGMRRPVLSGDRAVLPASLHPASVRARCRRKRRPSRRSASALRRNRPIFPYAPASTLLVSIRTFAALPPIPTDLRRASEKLSGRVRWPSVYVHERSAEAHEGVLVPKKSSPLTLTPRTPQGRRRSGHGRLVGKHTRPHPVQSPVSLWSTGTPVRVSRDPFWRRMSLWSMGHWLNAASVFPHVVGSLPVSLWSTGCNPRADHPHRWNVPVWGIGHLLSVHCVAPLCRCGLSRVLHVQVDIPFTCSQSHIC